MHIGTARAALFNWLYARHRGGKFLLRVEDTDRARSTDAAVEVIFHGLNWLGLEPDEPPVFQFARAERHREAVEQLLKDDCAYRCYMTVEELAAEREKARAAGRAIRSPWRDRDPPTGTNAPFVVRFRGPLEGETLVDDLIKGPVRFQNRELDDLVLLRSDGAPTYNLAVVVDDHDMGITHVIRGDDHLNNAGRQSLIYGALGWDRPAFAHMPLIHGHDGAKLSKRHGAQAVGEFEHMGYLPEAMRNYLARLGWGHGDDEIFSDEQAIAWFDIKDVVKGPARFDMNKLGSINNHYLRQAEPARLTGLVTDVLNKRGVGLDALSEARLERALPLVREGAKTMLELADLLAFAVRTRPVELDEKSLGLLTPETRERLARLAEHLKAAPDWTLDSLAAGLKAFAESEGVGMGKFGPALRGVLSGGSAAPDLASTLFALRREEALGRIDDALSRPA
jgi:glutamyl-tRNA synthetase